MQIKEHWLIWWQFTKILIPADDEGGELDVGPLYLALDCLTDGL